MPVTMAARAIPQILKKMTWKIQRQTLEWHTSATRANHLKDLSKKTARWKKALRWKKTVRSLAAAAVAAVAAVQSRLWTRNAGTTFSQTPLLKVVG